MFIVALFTVARTWKQPRCPSADDWIRKSWYLYTMEHYSAIKKNAFESVLMRWMKLEPMYRVKSERKMPVHYINAYVWNLERYNDIFGIMTTLSARQQKRHRYKKQNFGLCGRRQGWDDLRE